MRSRFEVPTELRDSPDLLDNTHLQAIGQAYLHQFGNRPSLFHCNHIYAKRLITECDTPHSRWNLLINIYAKLPNHNGWLAGVIRGHFQMAFNKGVSVREAYHTSVLPHYGSMSSMDKSMEKVSKELKEFVEFHFGYELNVWDPATRLG